MKNKIKLLSIKRLKSGQKKYIAEFEITTKDGKKKKKSTKFGAKGMSDYTIHKDTERRNRYIKRHTKDLRTNDPSRAGYLSMYILWNKKTYKASLLDYKRRLNTYNRTGKFPKSISGSSLKSKFGGVFRNTYIEELPPDIQDKIITEYYADRFRKGIEKLSKTEENLLLKLRQHCRIYNNISYNNNICENNWMDTIKPDDDKSSKLIKKASEILTKKSFDKKIWYNFLQYLLEQLDDIDPDCDIDIQENEDGVYDNEIKNLIISSSSIIKMLHKVGYYTDGISDCPKTWYSSALIWLQENEPDFINDENNFGRSQKNKVPNNIKNPKLYLKIKAKIQKDVKAKNRRWNAYDSSILVDEYKQAVGKLSKSIPDSSLKSKFGNYKNINYFGKVYLYPFLVNNTRFKKLPPDVIERIEQELQISDIINQYRSYSKKKEIFKLITSELGERQTDSIYEYIFEWDPNDEQTVEWLEEASKLLTKSDLEQLFWKEQMRNFIGGFIEETRYNIPSNNNFIQSKKYITILLNKINFKPPITDEIPFYERNDILNYFSIDYDNNFGKKETILKKNVPHNVKNPKLYLRIKAKIQKDIKAKNRRWGAYDSGRLVREYKQAGGKYSGTKTQSKRTSKSSNLDRWYREKWIDACAWPKRKSCGRTKASIKSKVTYCRPSKVINSNTPKTVQELTKAQIKKKCAKKSRNPKKIVRK